MTLLGLIFCGIGLFAIASAIQYAGIRIADALKVNQ